MDKGTQPATGGGLGTALLGALPVVGSAIQSWINNRQVERNQARQNQANMELAKYQYSRDLEMWNKANEYNAPAGQMARLKAAGLNPNMVYGGGGATTTAAQLPKFQAPTYQFSAPPAVDLPSMLTAYQDMQLRSAQIDNVRQQAHDRAMNNYWNDLGWTENHEVRGQAAPGEIAPLYVEQVSYGSARKQRIRGQARGISAEGYRKESPGYQELPGYQAEFTREKARNAREEYNKLMSEIGLLNLRQDLTRKQVEWYSGERIAQMLGVGSGAFSKLANTVKRTPRGKLLPSTVTPPRYNSPTRWEEFSRRFPRN